MAHPKHAKPDHPINELISTRWSPYGFSDWVVSDEQIQSIFEAARWAASSYNEQPWSYIIATRDMKEEFDRLLSCLMELNQAWAKSAPVLAIGCYKSNFTHNNTPNRVAQHDLGLAAGNICLQATALGLCVHQMAGILPDKVRELYAVPEGIHPLTALAIGYPADAQTLPESLKQRDQAPRPRKKLPEFVFGGKWGTASSVVK
jgi:nitroreductase